MLIVRFVEREEADPENPYTDALEVAEARVLFSIPNLSESQRERLMQACREGRLVAYGTWAYDALKGADGP